LAKKTKQKKTKKKQSRFIQFITYPQPTLSVNTKKKNHPQFGAVQSGCIIFQTVTTSVLMSNNVFDHV